MTRTDEQIRGVLINYEAGQINLTEYIEQIKAIRKQRSTSKTIDLGMMTAEKKEGEIHFNVIGSDVVLWIPKEKIQQFAEWLK